MLRSPRIAWIAALVVALVAGYFVAGSLLYHAFIGLDASAWVAGEAIQRFAVARDPELNNAVGGAVWLVVTLLAIAAFGFFVVRAAVRARTAETDPERRRFLTGAGAGVGAALSSLVVGAGVAASRGVLGVGHDNDGWLGISKIQDRDVAFTHPDPKPAWKGSRIRNHRRLGRTEWQISDIVLGTGRIRDENGERIAREAIDRGVNYFDTSPDYSGAGSEQAMGRAIQGVRDELFIATKFCTPIGHLPPGTPVGVYKAAVEGSLGRLGTDYVDLVHIHSCDELDRLLDPNVHEAFAELKQEGKARFLGFSTHTPNLINVANAAIDDGRFDVMKTLKGAKHRGLTDFEPYADSYVQAALKWTLSNPDVSCAVISFFEEQHVDEYIAASGRPFTPKDQAVLDAYGRAIHY